MYDVLVAWETMETQAEPAEIADYKALWLDTDKVVYSGILEQRAASGPGSSASSTQTQSAS
jgi:hypothetical protein